LTPASEPGPDPGRGLFETVLVVDGETVELERHLERLAASARALYGAEPVLAELAAAARAQAAGERFSRLRIELAPAAAAGELVSTLTLTPQDPAIFFPPRERGADLRSFTPPHWAGTHKLADRAWLERVEAEIGAQVPLILGPDGEVLEAGRANVFAVLGGALATPPLDGRILAGTARASTLELAAELGIAAAERTLGLAELGGAEEVFLTSSLRGIRPARSLDGEPLGEEGEVSTRLGRALRRRWLG